MRCGESGNVLFLILIAVALFAALSYVVTSTSRSGGGNVEGEKNAIAAGQLTRYPIVVRTAILRMKAGGTGDTSVSFDSNTWGHTDYRHTPPQTNPNQVFHPAGGGVPFERAPAEWLDSNFSAQTQYGAWLFTGSICVPGLAQGDSATCSGAPETYELMSIIPFINRSLCVELNRKLGVNPGGQGQPPQDQGNAWGRNTPV